MSDRDAERILELEEAAEGVELFRPPGAQLQVAKAADQAEASGWIPTREAHPAWYRLSRALISRRSLYRATMRLETVIARPTTEKGWIVTVDTALVEMGEALEEHIIEAEGPGGYLAEIVNREPRLVAQAETMKEEHNELLGLWRQARVAIATDRSDLGAVRRAVNTLLGLLLVHRQESSDLVFEAYNADIAAND